MPTETRQEWQDRHGGRDSSVYDEDEGVHIFPDGARCDHHWGGRQQEPPKDRHLLAKVMLRYWQLKLAEAVAEAEAYQSQLAEEAYAAKRQRRLISRADRKLEALRKLKDEARRCWDRVRAEEAKVAKTEPAEVKRRRLIRERDRRAYHAGSGGEYEKEHELFQKELDRIAKGLPDAPPPADADGAVVRHRRKPIGPVVERRRPVRVEELED